MPLLDVGYRTWTGERTYASTRWLVVASTGIRLIWRGTWLKRLMVVLLIPSAVALFFFGVFEQSAEDPNYSNIIRSVFAAREARATAARAGVNINEILLNPTESRHFVWSYLLFFLFRYPQAFSMILVIGLIAPRLISFDLRSRGYLLYLSRPLTPAEYVLGKACVIFFLLAMIAAVPALLIYIAGLFLSPNPWVLFSTWDIPLRVLIATCILAIPTTAIALAFSSLTQESRYAGFAWFTLWVVGSVSYQSLATADQLSRREPLRWGEYSHWMLFSPYETLGYLQQEVFGLTAKVGMQWAPWCWILLVSVIGYSLAYWRVARMLRV